MKEKLKKKGLSTISDLIWVFWPQKETTKSTCSNKNCVFLLDASISSLEQKPIPMALPCSCDFYSCTRSCCLCAAQMSCYRPTL